MANIFVDLFNMSITASYLILAIMIVRLLLKKVPKWITCLLWALVGIRLVFPFSIESALSLIPSSQTIAVNDSSIGRPFTIQSGVPAIDVNVNEFVASKYYEGVTVPQNTFTDMTTILAIVWLVGLFAMLLYGVISYLRLRKRVGVSLLFRDNIYYCDNIDTPFILGFLKPKIYVPSGLSEEQLNYITLHEKAHLKRKDHFWKPLGFVLLSVYWFNPVIWIAYVLFCRDIESACDEKVIKNMPNIEKKGYSETLVSCSVRRRMIMACPLAFGEVGVKQRIKSVLNYKKPAFWIIIVAVLLIIVIAVCFLTNPDGNSSSIGIIGGADGPTSIIVSGKEDTIDKILNEDGYEITSLAEKKISFMFDSQVITDKMFEKDGTYKVRSCDVLFDYIEFNFEKVLSDGDEFVLTFNIDYDKIPDKGTIYLINAEQFKGGLEIEEGIKLSDHFGESNSDNTYESYCISQRPNGVFSFTVSKEWLKNRSNNKIVVEIDMLELDYYKSDLSDNNYTYATSKTGEFYKINDSYYYAVIDMTMEYHEPGLYYSEPDGDKRLVCFLGGGFFNCLVEEDTFYYIQNDYKLYSVELKENAQPSIVAEKLYLPYNNYSIEKIMSASGDFVYCEAKHRGLREEYPDWDLVYLKINAKTGEFLEISQSDIPQNNFDLIGETYNKHVTENQNKETTQNSAIGAVVPPSTTPYVDYFTPDGERIFEQVSGQS